MSSQLKVNSIRDTSNNEALTISSGNVSFNNTISAGTIGDNVNTTNKYHLQLKVGANYTIGSGGSYINTTNYTNPYFTATGDTTNILPTDTNNIKIVRKGIYLVTFSCSTYQHSSTVSAKTIATIRGGTSVNPTAVISAAYDNIASADTSEPDWSNATATYVGELQADYYLRFQIEGNHAVDITIDSVTHVSICLLRPTA